jgi:hypothetical protein
MSWASTRGCAARYMIWAGAAADVRACVCGIYRRALHLLTLCLVFVAGGLWVPAGMCAVIACSTVLAACDVWMDRVGGLLAAAILSYPIRGG